MATIFAIKARVMLLNNSGLGRFLKEMTTNVYAKMVQNLMVHVQVIAQIKIVLNVLI